MSLPFNPLELLLNSLRPFLPLLLWLLPLIILLLIIRSPWFKGRLGEFQVNLLLRLFLDKTKYTVVRDVTIPTEDGGTTQLDHVLVSQFGVFVIETKNFKGWIFGCEQEAQWTQKIHKRHSQKFQNPLRQNYRHTRTLASLLGLPDDKVKGIVVFVGNSTFKTAMPDNVTYCRGCLLYVQNHNISILASDEVAILLQRIEEKRLARGFKTNRKHVAHLRARHAKTPVKPADNPQTAATVIAPLCEPTAAASIPNKPLSTPQTPPHCSNCGKRMVRRTAKRGINAGNEFWGCTGYPACREMRSITDVYH